MEPDLEYEAQKALVRILRMFARPGILTEGTIASVDEIKFICEVLMSDGKTKYGNVPLKVLIGSQASILEIPKVGTDCLLRFKDNSLQRPQLESVHEISKYLWIVGNNTLTFDVNGYILATNTTTLTMTTDGAKIVRGSSGLKKTLKDLIDAINLLTVPTGTGPSGVPINASTFTSIKNDLDNYLID
jgi:hypothetical protein